MEQQSTARHEQLQGLRPSQAVIRIRQRLEEVSESQIRISSARKQLLVNREKLRMTSRAVRSKRVDAGEAEAAFMSRLREFVNEYPEALSAALIDAYNKVTQSRDELGELEENYLKDERDLTGAEWTFMDQEDRFYQFDIHGILPEGQINEVASLYDPTRGYSPHHPAPSATLYQEGLLYPYQLLKPPFPPPPPPPPPPPHTSSTSQDSVDIPQSLIPDPDQGYASMVAEVDTLKREFDQLRQQQAISFEWDDENEVLFPEEDDLPVTDLTDSIGGYGDIVLMISYREAEAQRRKAEEMVPALDASGLTRRYSDPTHLLRPEPTCSTAMKRTQTESATISMRKDPTVKERIREWLLLYLKDSALQRQLYLNILKQHEVAIPVEGDWKIRAAQFWNNDSLVEIVHGNKGYAASVDVTGCEPGSCHNLSVGQSSIPSLSSQNLSGKDSPSTIQTAADVECRGSNEILQEVHISTIPGRSVSTPLLHFPQAVNGIEPKVEGPGISSDDRVLIEKQDKPKDGRPGDKVNEQVSCTCHTECRDANQRKDSVQDTNVTHHTACGKHGLGVKVQCSAHRPKDHKATTKTTTAYDHCAPKVESRSMDQVLPRLASIDATTNAFVEPSLDTTKQVTPPNLPIRHSDMFKPNIRPVSQRRRSSSSWFWNLIPRSKVKRSKSTPAAKVERLAAHARKQSVA